jgi:hypothetical protein
MAKPQTTHAEYEKYKSAWKKCRDAIAGEDAIHEAGDAYLPKLKGQSAEDYKSYVIRTPFYNAVGRTIDGLVGMVFRKEPKIEVPSAIESYLDDLTLTDTGIGEFAEMVTREILSVGRIGVLVEYPQIQQQPLSQAQASAQNIRPYLTTYKAESIINWRFARINNMMQPVVIQLAETVTEYANEFESVQVDQIRALILEDGAYIQRVYRRDSKDSAYKQFGNDIIPLMNGAPLPYIPFVFISSNPSSIDMPPVYDLVTLNLSHYRTSADLEHGAHFTGLPTAVVSGYQAKEGEKLSIGSSTAWVFPDPSAKASYLEFTGQGLDSLVNLKKDKELAMAALGARMLSPEKQAAEAYNTMRLRHSGEGAVLSSIVNMIDDGLVKALSIMAQWSGVDGEISCHLNKDFVDASLTAQDILAYVQAWQAGALPKEELFYNLKQGEIIRDETTFEMYTDSLEVELPNLGFTDGNG